MKRLTVLTATAALVLLVSGCGGASSSAQSSDGLSKVDTSAPLYDQLPAAVKKKDELVFAGDSHPPYRTVAADGKTITGIDPDLQAALSKQLGVPIKITLADDLPQMISGMQAGRYDAFNGPVSATSDRLASFDGVEWLTSRTSYLVPADSDVDDTAGLCGTTTAGAKGSITETQATLLSTWCEKQGKSPVKFLGLADTNATILAVKSGRAESAATTQAGALDVMRQQKSQWRYVVQTNAQGAGEDKLVLLTPKNLGMGEVMLKAFQAIFKDGEYAEIVKKYGLEDVAVDKPVLNPTVDQ
ncbi:MAG: transporter substrate-binding domain-containing protein [Nocardioides sp.]|uniref:transporter substrate-binding domain-containing protein n=1 Tax=Nocardioides sp. TaxID=35761 RepID=UPI0039E6A9A4